MTEDHFQWLENFDSFFNRSDLTPLLINAWGKLCAVLDFLPTPNYIEYPPTGTPTDEAIVKWCWSSKKKYVEIEIRPNGDLEWFLGDFSTKPRQHIDTTKKEEPLSKKQAALLLRFARFQY